MLCDLHDYGGALAPLGVGEGKTLISLLAPVVGAAEAPLLLVPAKLVEKTRRELRAYRAHWLVPSYVRIVSYELLGRAHASDLLEQIRPDLIVADECHKLKNSRAAVTRRVKRYFDKYPRTRLIAMSGTITKRSILDYAHIAKWALKGANPTPRDLETRLAWSEILDERPGTDEPPRVGALRRLCELPDELAELGVDEVRAVRRAYRRRLVETPGVVASVESALGASLRIDAELIAVPEVVHAVEALRRWERPDGEPVLNALEVWRHLRELALGFWYRWDPAPPDDWLEARRVWSRVVREVLRRDPTLDSEAQVTRAIAAGSFPEYAADLAAWQRLRPTYKPQTRAVWLSERVARRCASWLHGRRDDGDGGIAWVEHVDFGARVAELAGVPFFGRGGLDRTGRSILDHSPGKPLVCSIEANAEGRNLQAWSTNLVTSPPTVGATWEQLLGRTHRHGQAEDEVSCHLVIALREQAAAFERARADARYISDTTGHAQKLCYADVDVPASSRVPVLPTGELEPEQPS
ncbi:hypothetical protein DB32_000537 [Sandaracinus amylolyticus]|uniref:Uncharacterized protein n=1 Tax=Sandaracinus amylolyticus TaxID=927083 RepID=A0A0F6YG36_9BACT|nr:hypothetical protein DB32_000537 [Sandaracinus amylolyticus]